MVKDEMGIGSRIDQLRVQLAGCLTAAEGAIQETAKQGDYGWSLAYQRVLELRTKYEKAQARVAELETESEYWGGMAIDNGKLLVAAEAEMRATTE